VSVQTCRLYAAGMLLRSYCRSQAHDREVLL
jgi:hypothetical protein